MMNIYHAILHLEKFTLWNKQHKLLLHGNTLSNCSVFRLIKGPSTNNFRIPWQNRFCLLKEWEEGGRGVLREWWRLSTGIVNIPKPFAACFGHEISLKALSMQNRFSALGYSYVHASSRVSLYSCTNILYYV